MNDVNSDEIESSYHTIFDSLIKIQTIGKDLTHNWDIVQHKLY